MGCLLGTCLSLFASAKQASLAFNHFINSQKCNALTPEQCQDATKDKQFMKASIAQLVNDRKEVEKTIQHASQEVAKAKNHASGHNNSFSDEQVAPNGS